MKKRLDMILVERGLVKSRELAKAFVMEGKVLVDGRQVTKAGVLVADNSEITLSEAGIPFVGRGGLKLEAALDFFRLDAADKVVIDVGCSTGGFTDCLIQRGARKVYCVDVGYGQLAWSLRNDPRVVVMERTNMRYLDREIFGEKDSERKKSERFEGDEFNDLRNHALDLAAVDVSFISLTKVIPSVLAFLKEDGEIIALVKPQFEVGKGEVGKGGIVKDESRRLEAVNSVREDLERHGLVAVGSFVSPVSGQKGNIEYFLYMKRSSHGK
ncbi:MAG: TlyA family RNA methyltransferase [Nitrospirota bacterium]